MSNRGQTLRHRRLSTIEWTNFDFGGSDDRFRRIDDVNMGDPEHPVGRYADES